MVRLIKALCIPSIGSWLFLLAAQPLLVQHAAAQQAVEVPAVELPGTALRIDDLGLAEELPSAIDLIGPEQGSAGRHRAALALRLQCWIDDNEACTFADRNDERVREIRRFLVRGPVDRDGLVNVEFPDQTLVAVRLVRAELLDPNDWDQRVYDPVVLTERVQVPGLDGLPSQPAEFQGLAYDGAASIRAALERLKQRMQASVDAGGVTAHGKPSVQGQF